MNTKTHEAGTKKRHTTTEIEGLDSEVGLGQLSCAQLCAERANDFDILDNLGDYPPKQRAAVRAATIRDIIAVNVKMRQSKCPACDE